MASSTNSFSLPSASQIKQVILAVAIAKVMDFAFANNDIAKLLFPVTKGVTEVLLILLILAALKPVIGMESMNDSRSESSSAGESRSRGSRRRRNRRTNRPDGSQNPPEPEATNEPWNPAWNASEWQWREYPRPWSTPLPVSRQIEARGRGQFSINEWINWDPDYVPPETEW